MSAEGDSPAPLPKALQSTLWRILYGAARLRHSSIEKLLNDHPAHASGIQAEVRLFEEARLGCDQEATFGRFRVIRTLGEGSFGRVLLAEEPPPVKRRVAIKVFKQRLGSCDGHAKEFHAIAALNHDHIAKCFDRGVQDGQAFLVLEYVEDARSLTTHCANEGLSLTQRITLFQHACHALHHAHERGVLHLDVKPGNILVAKQEGGETLKVVDFGQARMLEVDPEERTGLGTPPYTAPEQLQRKEVDRRADVYSLGACLYHLLVDQRPLAELDLDSASTRSILEAYVDFRPLPSKQIRTDHPWVSTLRGDLDAIVSKAMALEPIRRYQSAKALAEDLDNFLAIRPVEARNGGPGYRLAKLIRRRRRLIYTSLSLLVALAVIVSALFQQPPSAPTVEAFRSPGQGPQKFRTLEQSPSRLVPGDLLGISVHMHESGRIAALSLTQEGNQPIRVQVTEPNLRETMVGTGPRSNQLVLSLDAGRHDILLCQLDREARAGDGSWREGLWVFQIADTPTGNTVGAWLEDLRRMTASRPETTLEVALQTLRTRIQDQSRGGPVGEMSEADRTALSTLLASRRLDEWPLPSMSPQVFWWTVEQP